jgi:hypothetical protein
MTVHANARACRPRHLKDIHARAPLANLSPIQRYRIENVSRDYVANNFRDLGSHDVARNSDLDADNLDTMESSSTVWAAAVVIARTTVDSSNLSREQR